MTELLPLKVYPITLKVFHDECKCPNRLSISEQNTSVTSFFSESFHCLLTPDKNFIKFDLDLRYYQHSQLSAIDYVNFIGSGTDTNPGEDGVLDYIDDMLCGANTDSLPFPGTANARATRSFETPLADGPGQCGVIVVSIHCWKNSSSG